MGLVTHHISHVYVTILYQECFYSGYWSVILSLHIINSCYHVYMTAATHMHASTLGRATAIQLSCGCILSRAVRIGYMM